MYKQLLVSGFVPIRFTSACVNLAFKIIEGVCRQRFPKFRIVSKPPRETTLPETRRRLSAAWLEVTRPRVDSAVFGRARPLALWSTRFKNFLSNFQFMTAWNERVGLGTREYDNDRIFLLANSRLFVKKNSFVMAAGDVLWTREGRVFESANYFLAGIP